MLCFQRWIYNVEDRRIDVAYFNVDIKNVRQLQNNNVIFNVEFHNIDQSWNNFMNMTMCKKLKIAKKCFWG